jgi:serine/threonine-protein kinase
MLTGRTPRADPERAAAPASSVNPYVPAAVDAVLAAGLAHRPDRRPASAGRLVGALALALGVAPAPPPPRASGTWSRLLGRRR